MGLDINSEVMKAAVIMNRYHVPREEQLEIVRILIACGVEHCLNEMERVRQGKEDLIDAAYGGPVN